MQKSSTFRCELCGNIVEVLDVGGGTLNCCGQDMKLLEESTADTSTEKHVPFIEKTDLGYKVKVGQNQEHPMMEAHSILWIELHTTDAEYRVYLKPSDKPEAIFPIGHNQEITGAREYCNLHGLWKG